MISFLKWEKVEKVVKKKKTRGGASFARKLRPNFTKGELDEGWIDRFSNELMELQKSVDQIKKFFIGVEEEGSGHRATRRMALENIKDKTSLLNVLLSNVKMKITDTQEEKVNQLTPSDVHNKMIDFDRMVKNHSDKRIEDMRSSLARKQTSADAFYQFHREREAESSQDFNSEDPQDSQDSQDSQDERVWWDGKSHSDKRRDDMKKL